MNRILKPFLKKLFGLLNFHVSRVSHREDLIKLISKLHPVQFPKGMIRLGADSDGGYLVPNALNGIEYVFSPGVGYFDDFELDCANRGMKVYLADASVDNPPDDHKNFSFLKKFIGSRTCDDYITLDDWVASTDAVSSQAANILIQMDIEGGEYETLLSCSKELLSRFKIVIIEFHELDQLFNLSFFKVASSAIYKLLSTHACIHIHPNNCCGVVRVDGIDIPPVMEFTFIKKELVNDGQYKQHFPDPLDFDNTNRPSVILPNIWHH